MLARAVKPELHRMRRGKAILITVDAAAGRAVELNVVHRRDRGRGVIRLRRISVRFVCVRIEPAQITEEDLPVHAERVFDFDQLRDLF